jgi:hypothetical protein
MQKFYETSCYGVKTLRAQTSTHHAMPTAPRERISFGEGNLGD